MAEQRNLIDQALSIIEESGPPRLGKSIPLDPQQALVWSIYTATRDREAGHGSEAEVKNFVKIARSRQRGARERRWVCGGLAREELNPPAIARAI